MCLCAVGGPFGSFRKQIRSLNETVSGQRCLYSFVGAVLSRRFLLYNRYRLRFSLSMQLNVMAASIMITRRVCDSFTPPSLLPGANGLQVSLFFPQWLRSPPPPPSLPSLQPRQALPALEIYSDNGWLLGADSWGLSPPTGQSWAVQDAEVSHLCAVIRFVGFSGQ